MNQIPLPEKHLVVLNKDVILKPLYSRFFNKMDAILSGFQNGFSIKKYFNDAIDNQINLINKSKITFNIIEGINENENSFIVNISKNRKEKCLFEIRNGIIIFSNKNGYTQYNTNLGFHVKHEISFADCSVIKKETSLTYRFLNEIPENTLNEFNTLLKDDMDKVINIIKLISGKKKRTANFISIFFKTSAKKEINSFLYRIKKECKIITCRNALNVVFGSKDIKKDLRNIIFGLFSVHDIEKPIDRMINRINYYVYLQFKDWINDFFIAEQEKSKWIVSLSRRGYNVIDLANIKIKNRDFVSKILSSHPLAITMAYNENESILDSSKTLSQNVTDYYKKIIQIDISEKNIEKLLRANFYLLLRKYSKSVKKYQTIDLVKRLFSTQQRVEGNNEYFLNFLLDRDDVDNHYIEINRTVNNLKIDLFMIYCFLGTKNQQIALDYKNIRKNNHVISTIIRDFYRLIVIVDKFKDLLSLPKDSATSIISICRNEVVSIAAVNSQKDRNKYHNQLRNNLNELNDILINKRFWAKIDNMKSIANKAIDIISNNVKKYQAINNQMLTNLHDAIIFFISDCNEKMDNALIDFFGVNNKVLNNEIIHENYSFNQLITKEELNNEAKEMNHCVDGYYGLSKYGSIILSVKPNFKDCKQQDRSTVELRLRENQGKKLTCKIRQNRSFANASTTNQNNNAVLSFVKNIVLDKYFQDFNLFYEKVKKVNENRRTKKTNELIKNIIKIEMENLNNKLIEIEKRYS